MTSSRRLLTLAITSLAFGAFAQNQMPPSARPRETMGPQDTAKPKDTMGHPMKMEHHTASMEMIQSWPEPSKKAAKAMMEKYGPPTELTESTWIWKNNAPFVKTVVSSDPLEHNFPIAHQDVLTQTINYKVPADKMDELAKFDGAVIVDRVKGTLSARCDKEEMNFITLNIANEVITGKRGVDAARRFLGRNVADVMKGEAPPYAQGLVFTPSITPTADPDQPLRGMPEKVGTR